MIGKAKSNKSTSVTINYNDKEHSVLCFTQNLKGENIEDFKMEFSDLQQCYNGRSRNLIIHAQLSPSIEDGQRLTIKDWEKIGRAYLHKMNLPEHQAIGFLHQDKMHRHLHMVINRVSEKDFSLYNDSFISKKTEKIADEIAREMGLQRAKQVMLQNQLYSLRRKEVADKRLQEKTNPEKPKGAKMEFQHDMENALASGVMSLEQLFNTLKNYGYVIHRYYNRETGLLRGYALERNGTRMDASSINRKYSISQLTFPYIDKDERETKNLQPDFSKIFTLTDTKKIYDLKSFLQELGLSENELSILPHKFILNGKVPTASFLNDSEGAFLISPYGFKHAGANDITYIHNPKAKTVIVVEDIADFALAKKKLSSDILSFIILNSPANKDKAVMKLHSLQGYRKILLLKRDSLGFTLARQIAAVCKGAINCTQHNLEKNNNKIKSLVNQKNVYKHFSKGSLNLSNTLNISMAKGVINNNDGLFEDFYELKNNRHRSLGL